MKRYPRDLDFDKDLIARSLLQISSRRILTIQAVTFNNSLEKDH